MGRQLTGEPITITSNRKDFQNFQGAKINYSNEDFAGPTFSLKPHQLLFETGIRDQDTTCFVINDQKVFFRTEGDWPFDIFAATFYLISRYEEYLPHKKDEYGRYAHVNSLAYKEGFLSVPLVNVWIDEFKVELKKRFSSEANQLGIKGNKFSFIPTYDIDEAYSFKHKQWWRTQAGLIKDLLRRNTARYALRKKVMAGKKADPFDSYDWMDALHERFVLHPHYFFLLAPKTAKYDRNILPYQKAMQDLIHKHAEKYSLGIHPSWQSYGKKELVKSEIEMLESLSGQKIISSRQHYIRFELPSTYRLLTEAGILKDFSMGYGSINGFRASVASPFYWYDLEKEESTSLLLYPYCFMDANSFFEQKQSPAETLIEMRYYYKTVKAVNGILIMIWHNTFLGTDELFAGWREIYKQFIEEISN
jgi:hypothetical protein